MSKSTNIWGFSDSSVGKESACNAGDLGSIPGLGRSPGEGKGYSLQYSGLENSMDCGSPWGGKQWDATERLSLSLTKILLYSLMNERTNKMLKSAQRAFKKLGIHRKC